MMTASTMTDGQAIASRGTPRPRSEAGAEIGEFCECQFIMMAQVIEQLAHARRDLVIYPEFFG